MARNAKIVLGSLSSIEAGLKGFKKSLRTSVAVAASAGRKKYPKVRVKSKLKFDHGEEFECIVYKFNKGRFLRKGFVENLVSVNLRLKGDIRGSCEINIVRVHISNFLAKTTHPSLLISIKEELLDYLHFDTKRQPFIVAYDDS